MKARQLLDEIFDVPLRQRLLEAVPIAVPEVRRAYLAWTAQVHDSVLIGALAAGAYSAPQTTLDVDMLFLNEQAVPEAVPGFKRLRAHAFEHRETGVKVEARTPEFLRMSAPLAQKMFETARGGVASAEGVIAAKLQRGSLRDQGHVAEILRAHPEIDLDGWPLSGAQRELFAQIRRAPRHETPRE